MKVKMIILWGLQIMVACIFIYTSWSKLSGQPTSIYIFTKLGMEPNGRIIIGVIELMSALFLLNRRLAASGAFIATGVMLGAIIAHATVIGFNVLHDGGRHISLLVFVFVSSLTITIMRRRQIPLIGNTFGEERLPYA